MAFTGCGKSRDCLRDRGRAALSALRKQFEINEPFSACAVEMDTQRVFPQPLSATPAVVTVRPASFSSTESDRFPSSFLSCPFNGTAEAVPFQIEHSIQSPKRPDLGFYDHMRRTAIACLTAASAVIDLRSRAQKKEAGPEEHSWASL